MSFTIYKGLTAKRGVHNTSALGSFLFLEICRRDLVLHQFFWTATSRSLSIASPTFIVMFLIYNPHLSKQFFSSLPHFFSTFGKRTDLKGRQPCISCRSNGNAQHREGLILVLRTFPPFIHIASSPTISLAVDNLHCTDCTFIVDSTNDTEIMQYFVTYFEDTFLYNKCAQSLFVI